jgi:hypothetical protein
MVEIHKENETPFGFHCRMHGGWTPSVIGCKHIWKGEAGLAQIQLH